MDNISKQIKATSIWNQLMKIQKEYPRLTHQNKGYSYLPKKVLDSHYDIIKEITTLIHSVYPYITKFNNFLYINSDIHIRCQGKWADDFIGVIYKDKNTFIYGDK